MPCLKAYFRPPQLVMLQNFLSTKKKKEKFTAFFLPYITTRVRKSSPFFFFFFLCFVQCWENYSFMKDLITNPYGELSDNTIQTSQTNSQKLTKINVFVVEQNNAISCKPKIQFLWRYQMSHSQWKQMVIDDDACTTF